MSSKRTTHLALIAGATFVGLLTGCASGQQPPLAAERHGARISPTSASSVLASSSSRAASYRRAPVTYARLRTVPTPPPGTISQTWTVTRATGDRLYLSATVPACSSSQTFTLQASSTTITVGYWAKPRPQGLICTAPKVNVLGYVQLPSPPARRALDQVPAGKTAARP